jgi:16S rRNA (cytidine1402-2'-O)-methyltransferase
MNKDRPGVLYVVSTPIGNLSDITLRALEVLKGIDYVVCEDTRVTIKLLNRYQIKKPLISFHSKSRESVLKRIIRIIFEGHSVALVSDSGTPAISDPGSKLIKTLLSHDVIIVPVPGPSSVHTALVASGFSISDYTFIGFLSNKASRRKRRLESLKSAGIVYVFFESPHRIMPFLEDVLVVFGNVKGCVAKEMTKKFERYYRGNITDIIGQIQADGVKGEYTVVIDNR